MHIAGGAFGAVGVTCLCLTVACAGAAAGGAGGAGQTGKPVASWPGWRGPNGDDTSPDVPEAMPTVTLLWKKPMTSRCDAGVVAADGLVVVADNDPNKQDYYRCYEADTGKEVWVYAATNTGKLDYSPAPRATPLIHQGRLFCMGAFGDVHCIDMKTGKSVWRKSYEKDFAAGRPPTWGYCLPPMIVDGKLILLPAKIVALEPATGNVVWTGPASGPNYSAMLAATFGGVRQIVGYDSKALAGWDAKTGKRLWELEVDTSKGYIVPSPVAAGQKLLVTSQDEDTRLYGFDKDGKVVAKPEAESEEIAPEMASPTIHGDLVLCVNEGLVCLDLKDNLKKLWIQEKPDAFVGMGYVVAGKDNVLVFGENGTMVLVKADRRQCTVLGTAKLCQNTWSHPAIAGGKVYIRDERFLHCYELKAGGAASAPKPAAPAGN